MAEPHGGYAELVLLFASVLVLVTAAAVTLMLMAFAVRSDPLHTAMTRVTRDGDPFRTPAPDTPDQQAHRVRLVSRLLFSRRTADAFTLDCMLVTVDGDLPDEVDPPEGLPFALRVRCPETSWFADRVEGLLSDWAEETRELTLELTPDRGRVRTTIASGDASVHLELAGAAGLGTPGLSA